jgi:hypothetical protein
MMRGLARTRSRLEDVFNGLDCTLNLQDAPYDLQRVVTISSRLDLNAAIHSSTVAGGSVLPGLRLRRSTRATSNRSQQLLVAQLHE